MKARSSWLIGRPNFLRSSGSAGLAGVRGIVFDHVADDGVHHANFLGRVHADADADAVVSHQSARAHHAHDHLRGLADAAGGIDLEELGEREHFGAVAHDVALGRLAQDSCVAEEMP